MGATNRASSYSFCQQSKTFPLLGAIISSLTIKKGTGREWCVTSFNSEKRTDLITLSIKFLTMIPVRPASSRCQTMLDCLTHLLNCVEWWYRSHLALCGTCFKILVCYVGRSYPACWGPKTQAKQALDPPQRQIRKESGACGGNVFQFRLTGGNSDK